MLVWIITRHVFYLMVVYSIYADIPKEIRYGCYSGSNENLTGPSPAPDSFAHLIDPFRDPQGVVCWNNEIKWAFIYTLLALQVILCVWFGMIVKVALKVLRGGEAEDSRSDDEGDDDEEEDEEDMDEIDPNPTNTPGHNQKATYYQPAVELPPIEKEVGAEGLNFAGQRHSPSRRFRKSGGVASGVNLHSDPKELLGRIGCDKQPE